MPINPTTLKALIDTQITNETVNFAITPAEVGGRMKDTIDYTTEQINGIQLIPGPTGPAGPSGPVGAQGVQGPAGAIGPVGPAGLEWQGEWDLDSSYFVNDAVGFAGASYFCILNVDTTSNPFPDEDTTHWALLASQGAQGPQGVQGPTGPQGPTGTPSYTEGSLNSNSQSIAGNPATSTGKITLNFTRAYVTSSTNNFLGLSNIGKDTGGFYVVQNKSTTLDLIVIPIDGTEFLQPNGFSSQVNFTIKPKTYARFTLADNDSGSAKTFMVEVINPLGASGTEGSANFKGQWDFNGLTTYEVGDIVTTFTYDNTFQYQMWGSYICTTSNTSNVNPGISNDWVQLGLTKLAKGTRLKGVGTATDPITLKGYKRVSYIYATGTGNPQRQVNFFNGMELPPGVTETIVRVSTGTYELRYTAEDGNAFVGNLSNSNFFEYSFDLNNNISYGGTFTTTSGGNRTLVLPFTNKVNDVLTDGFSVVKYSFEWYE